MSWGDIPTCKEVGRPTDYLMLRGIFMAPRRDARPGRRSTSTCSKKVRETPEWKDFMEKGAFNTTSMSGDEFRDWLDEGRERCTSS